MNVLHINSVDFAGLSLGEPVAVQGGSFYAKIYVASSDSMLVQLPRCCLKQGVVATKRGKYCDLLYDRDAVSQLAAWIEAFETAIQDRIDAKKHVWFQGELTRGDIETMMAPLSRSYKSGRCMLVRAHLDVDRRTGDDRCVVYDEEERLVGTGAVQPDNEIVPLVHLGGVRFTSRSFEVDVKLIQAMVLAERPNPHETCLIKVAGVDVSPEERLRAAGHELTALGDESVMERGAEIVEHEPVPEKRASPDTPSDIVLEITDVRAPADTSSDPTMSEIEGVETPLDTVGPVEIESVKGEPSGRQPCREICEVDVDPAPEGDAMVLRDPEDVYMEIYRTAREKAKRMRKAAADAYLEARRIRSQYLLDDIDSSDECGEAGDAHPRPPL